MLLDRPEPAMPERIQLRRTKGWRKPEGAVVVARPSGWGNPFVVDGGAIRWWHRKRTPKMRSGTWVVRSISDRREAALTFRWWLTGQLRQLHAEGAVEIDTATLEARREQMIAALDDLRGHDLACWCPLDQPCHADVLLDLANRPPRADRGEMP